ncbi:MAG: hypothetical protein V7L20_09185 [Nostoc sp.]
MKIKTVNTQQSTVISYHGLSREFNLDLNTPLLFVGDSDSQLITVKSPDI